MGYTVYWEKRSEVSRNKYNAIVRDFRSVLKELRFNDDLKIYLNLAGARGEGKPVIHKRFKEVVFNEVKENDTWNEPFRFSVDEGVAFCKTDQKPYDIAVKVFLIIAKHYLGNKLIVTTDGVRAVTDGDSEKWERAYVIVKNRFGYEDFYLGEETAVIEEIEEPEEEEGDKGSNELAWGLE